MPEVDNRLILSDGTLIPNIWVKSDIKETDFTVEAELQIQATWGQESWITKVRISDKWDSKQTLGLALRLLGDTILRPEKKEEK